MVSGQKSMKLYKKRENERFSVAIYNPSWLRDYFNIINIPDNVTIFETQYRII